MLLAQEPKTGCPWALRELPSFPALALQVMQELSHQEPDFRKVTSLINSEPAFAGELLRVSNCALFGFSSEIRSVPQAIVNLDCWLSDSLGFGSLPANIRLDLGEYTPAPPEALLARLDVEGLMATTSARISSLE